MSNIFFTSDTHFFHKNIIGFCRSQFSSVEEMNEYLIAQWNSVVQPGDKVYHLGDVFLGPSTHEQRAKLWARLKGSKRLIVGNHDDIKYLASGGFFKRVELWRIWNDLPLLFTHVPVHPSNINERVKTEGGVNVHGHTHEKGSPEGPYYSVCGELHDFVPQELSQLKEKVL